MRVGVQGQGWSRWRRRPVGVVRGDVEEPVTDGLGGGSAEWSDAADVAGPSEEVVGGEAELHPGFVVHDVVEGEVGEAGGLGVADDVLGAGEVALA